MARRFCRGCVDGCIMGAKSKSSTCPIRKRGSETNDDDHILLLGMVTSVVALFLHVLDLVADIADIAVGVAWQHLCW